MKGESPLLFQESDRPPSDPKQQAVSLLGLSTIKGVGHATLRKLYSNYPDLAEIWDADSGELCRVLSSTKVRNHDKIAASIKNLGDQLLDAGKIALEKLENRGIHLLAANHACFPETLKHVPNRPYWLFVEGDPYLLLRRSLVAVVGTRRASDSGISLTKELVKELISWGYTVVSGLADGIDTAAHETVVEYGGKTVAVLGNGLNIDFPASNRELRRSIITHGGSVVTDHFPDTMYSAANFVNRNRIIAGLSSVVIPIESSAQSGTAHTIRFAEECKTKLIGVIKSGHYENLANEIPSVLREKGHPVINLSTSAEFQELRTMLEEFGHDAQPIRADFKNRQEACYAEVIQAFNKAFNRCPLDEKGFEWLMNVLESEMGKRKNAH